MEESGNKSIAVLVPCYNESMSIGAVIEDFRQNLPEAVIYVYDNNSTDNTDQIARDMGVVVRYEHRQGKGNVVRSMACPPILEPVPKLVE